MILVDNFFIWMKEQEQPTEDKVPFKVGMTLDQYFEEMKMEKMGNQEEKVEEDLFETSKMAGNRNSNKLITYEIKQTDEDNYDESANGDLFEESYKHGLQKQNKRSNGKINFPMNQIDVQGSFSNSKGFRVRKQSQSPYKQMKKDPSSLTPNKNAAKTLYSNDWKHFDPTKIGTATLYGKFLKSIKEKKNQKYFRQKNTKELEYVLKYEQNLNKKYSNYREIQIRVDGFTDRLHERQFKHKMIK